MALKRNRAFLNAANKGTANSEATSDVNDVAGLPVRLKRGPNSPPTTPFSDLDFPDVEVLLRSRRIENSAPASDLELEFVTFADESEREGSSSSDVQIIPDTVTSEPPPRQILRPVIRASGANASELTYPKSQYMGWTPPMEITPEAEAVAHLMAEWRRLESENPKADAEDVEFELSEFCVYATERTTALAKDRKAGYWDRYVGGLEMVSLHALRANKGTYPLLFDGVLSCGNLSYYIQAAPFGPLSIGGYGMSIHSVLDDLWIQSRHCAQDSTLRPNRPFYRLQQPRNEYLRYHEVFLWIANLGKHFVDYLQYNTDKKTNVHFSQFESDFHSWLVRQHGRSDQFQKWLRAFGHTDFRVAIAAHVEHLWTEATDMNDKLRSHFVWKEVDPKALKAIRTQLSVFSRPEKTVVSPLVYETFKNIYFSQILEARVVTDPVVEAAQRSRKKALGFMTDGYIPPLSDAPQPEMQPISPSIDPGNVVGVSRDVETVWENTKSEIWFAYVRAIHEDRKGKYLTVTWLYRAEDTTLASMNYPFPNELFMSDHCNCGERTFRIEEVNCQIKVNWYPHQIPASNEFFVRQKYCTKEQAFVTIKPQDFVCTCEETTNLFQQATNQYEVQDTVLAEFQRGQSKRLDPVVVVEFIPETEQIQVRQLIRTCEALNGDHAPNELIWTDRLMFLPAKIIKRKCQVRFALPAHEIPTLYTRGGQADLFLVTHCLIHRNGEDNIHVLEEPLPGPMTEGIDPAQASDRPPMKLLSLFSGGGNFDRGLEEGGCVCTKWAVEWNSFAAHTYRANCKEPEETNIFLGSVDEFLARAIDGKTSKLIPQVGEVDCICGGSPCQGFSQMQPNTQSTQSLTNASKVASVAAYIDHYRPSYALLENVVSMTRPLGPNKENVFSQMLCALVAMGYQVQQFNLDAWSFGDPQSRSRLFIASTAPGLVPMPHPSLTHSHPPGKANRKLGKAVNGEAFGERCFDVTPFSFVTAKEATKDLPVLGDGHVLACIPFPDHRQHTRQRVLLRNIMKLIPTSPPGMNLVRTQQTYTIPVPVREYLDRQPALRRLPTSNALCRIIGDGLFPTVVTKLGPEDGKAGRGLHWNQPRTQTLLEARRAQGFLDHEPLIGLVSAQWKIVGNSVARSVSLALGMSLREAWLGNPEHLMRRVTAPIDTVSRLMAPPEVNSREVARARPVVLISTESSFDRSEYDSYDDCEINSEDWTDVDMGGISDEPMADTTRVQVAEDEDGSEDWSEVDDIIANVLGSLLAGEDIGAMAEAVAQEKVAIEPVESSENTFEVFEDPVDQSRPRKVARK